ncbi:unnamed protein product, partial [Gordionus sp. m RMFG-2023]
MEEFIEFSSYMRSSLHSKIFIGINLSAIILGLIGNFIYFLCAFKLKRHSHFYIYIYYLIVNDTLSCICHLFWPVATYLKGDMMTNYYIAIFTSKTTIALAEFTRYNVNWMNVIIAADRYAAIRKPLLYKRLTLKRNILLMTLTSTLVNLLFSIPYVFRSAFLKINREIFEFSEGNSFNVSSYNVTIYYSKGVDKPWMYSYDTFILYFMYLTPVALTLIGNLEFYRAICRKKHVKISPQTESTNMIGKYANQLTALPCQAQNSSKYLEDNNQIRCIRMDQCDRKQGNGIISNNTNNTLKVLLQSYLNPNMKVEIPKRYKNSNKFYKLIIVQNVCLIVSTLPFIIYTLVTKNFVAVKLLEPFERGPHLFILTLRYLYTFLEVYINIFFDPDIKNIIKS